MDQVRMGIIGFGFRARGILTTFQSMPERYEVVAVADRDDEPLCVAGQMGKFKTFTDYQDLLADKTVDAVLIATPQDSHARIALAALGAGKHVYCEKPMALTLADCDAMIAAAERAGRVLLVGLQMRYSVHLQTMARMIAQGVIGAPGMMWIAEYRNPFPATMLWAFDKTRSGGVLVEKSCHHFDVFNWFASSRPLRVYASGDALVHKRIFGLESTIADHAVVTVEYANGCKASYRLCMFAGAPDEQEYGLGYHFREVGVLGPKGLLRTEGWDLGRRRIEQRFPDNASRVIHELSTDAQKLTPYNQDGNIGIFWEFHECVTRHRKPFTTGQVGRDSIAVALAAEESMATGKPVAVPPI